MTKFKVGDKVQVINENNTFGFSIKVGDVGVITSIGETQMEIVFGITPQWQRLNSKAIELVSKKDKHKTELRIVYKVVSNCPPNKFASYWGVSDYELEYVIGKQTKTPKGWNPLFTFDTLEHARMEHPDILKCVAKVRIDDTDFSFMRGCAVPLGTVLCDWVFPIERVGSE